METEINPRKESKSPIQHGGVPPNDGSGKSAIDMQWDASPSSKASTG